MADLQTDHLTESARGIGRRAASTLTDAVRAVLRAVMAIPMLVGRLGVVAGKAGVHLGTVLGTLSTWLSSGSDRARGAMEKAKEIDVKDLHFEAPRVVTTKQRRKERGRRIGLVALGAGAAAGIGAGIAWVARKKRDEAAAVEEALWSTPEQDPWASNGNDTGNGDDEVIDVSTADR